MHTIEVTLRERYGASMMEASSSTIVRPRLRLIGMLDRMDAAGCALRWLRQSTPMRATEPYAWLLVQDLLDSLDKETLDASPRSLLIVAGLRLLSSIGYGLDLDACVVCRKTCPDDRSSFVDPVRGGLVCRGCGGAGRMISGTLRLRVKNAVDGNGFVEDADGSALLDLVESALLVHASVTRGCGSARCAADTRSA